MSTPNLTLYQIETDILNLMLCRESVQDDPDLTPKEIEKATKEIDLAIRERVTAEVRKVDGIAHYFREFEARAATAKEEAKRIKRHADAWGQRYESLETLVKSVMLMSGKARLDGDANTLRLVKCPPSVEIAQPELVPDEYRKFSVALPLRIWNEVVRFISSSEGSPELHHALCSWAEESRGEPSKSKIAEALKQTELCVRCDSTGIVTIPLELRIPEDNFKGHEKCVQCKGTGKVSKGVPGCRLIQDKMSLRVE